MFSPEIIFMQATLNILRKFMYIYICKNNSQRKEVINLRGSERGTGERLEGGKGGSSVITF